MSDDVTRDLKGDIESFFDGLHREFGRESPEDPEVDDGEFDLEEVDLPDTTPPEPVRDDDPIVPAIPPAPGSPPPDDEDDHYPGSRQVRRGPRAPADDDADPAPVWDTKPRVYRVGGKDVEFFTISALATALRRQPGTLRKWETNGWVPSARFRAPGEGKSQARLYTRAQIEGLVVLAHEEGLMEPEKKLRIDQTSFPARAQRLFTALERRNR